LRAGRGRKVQVRP